MTGEEAVRMGKHTRRTGTIRQLTRSDDDALADWHDLVDSERARLRGRELVELRALRSLIRLIDQELAQVAGQARAGGAGGRE